MTPFQETKLGQQMLAMARGEGKTPRYRRAYRKIAQAKNDDHETLDAKILVVMSERPDWIVSAIGQKLGVRAHIVRDAMGRLQAKGLALADARGKTWIWRLAKVIA